METYLLAWKNGRGMRKSCQLEDKIQGNWREIVFKNGKSQTSGPLSNVKIKSRHHCYMVRISYLPNNLRD